MTDVLARPQRTPPPSGVAEALPVALVARFAGSFGQQAADWPDQPAEHPDRRTSVRVALTATHDVWLIRWPAGTRVRPHDHGDSVGAFSVVSGELLEVRWDEWGASRSRRVEPGQTVAIDHGVIHDVVGCSEAAISVHVYSPPLSSMRIFDDDAVEVVERELVEDVAGPDHDAARWSSVDASVWQG